MATTFVDYTGDGDATKQFSFPSYKVEDIKVEVNEVLKTVSTHYNITSYSTTGGGNVVFTSGNIPTSPDRIRIFRDTDVDTAKATYAAGSSVKADDLNNNQTQILYAAQEEQNQTIQTHKIKDQAVTTAKIKDANVTTVKIADSAITTAKIADSNITTAKIADDAVTMAKLGSGALPTDITVNSSNIVDLTVATADIAADAVTNAKIADDSIDSEHYVDGSIDTAHIGGAQVTDAKLASNSVTTSKITDSNVTTVKIADSNVTLAKLASDLKQTTISDSDTQLPTSGAVVDYVAAQLEPFGGFEAIANEVSFPNTQPVSGVAISIADAEGVVVNNSGVSTTGRTVGGTTVTINNIPSNFRGSTVAAGIRFIVTSTGSGQIYNYHKATLSETDLVNLSGDINDFGERYRVGSSNPTTNNDSGDLFFNTGSGKMFVYDGTISDWEEVQSVGSFFINTLSSSSATGGGSATFNNNAYRFTLSNAGTVAEQHLVSINGVIQKPNSGTSQPSEGFAIDGGDIIFSAAPSSGADFFIITIGSTVNINTPSAGSVSTSTIASGAVVEAKIADGAVTSTKIADGTIVNADISSSAAIDASKIANLTTDAITEGNSKAEVIGSGTSDGEFKVTLQDATSNGGGETALRMYHSGSYNIFDLFPNPGNASANSRLILNNLTTTNAWSEIQFKLSGASSGTTTIRANSGTSLQVFPTATATAQFQVGATSSYFQGTLYTKALIPLADSTSDIGSNSVRYRNLYADTLYGDGSNLTGVSSQVADGCITENSQTISNDYTITTNKNALSAGPITIANGVTLTIPSGSVYTIV